MSAFVSSWNAASPPAQQRRAVMVSRIERLRALEGRAAEASAQSAARFAKRQQLLPRATLITPNRAEASRLLGWPEEGPSARAGAADHAQNEYLLSSPFQHP